MSRGPVLARDPVDISQGERVRSTVARKVGRAGLRLSGVWARAREPMAKLLQHPRIVVEDFEYVVLDEERIHVRVGIEANAAEKIGMLAGKGRNNAGGGLQVAPLVMAHLTRVNVVGERARELRRVGRSRQVFQVVVGKDDVVLRP